MKVVGVLAAALAAAAFPAWAALESSASRASASCAATIVHYQAAKHRTLHDVPWVLGRPTARGVLGFVVSYPETLGDGRVNGSDGIVLWRTGGRIVWAGVSSGQTLAGRRLDGRGSFRLRLGPSPDGPVSDLRFPSAGCWRLRVGAATLVVRVVPRPVKLGCDATLLRTRGAFARPLSSRILGGWGPWRTAAGGALLYTHGHGAGWNMKVLWRVERGGGSLLTLAGARLDADGSFAQEFPMTNVEGVFPSTVDVPAAGCWLFRLRTGRLAGVLVVQAVDDRG
jgi:hypothetical protein